MKYEKHGIPYMGSKRKIAEGLFDVMLQVKPRAKYFYDLFGGGGAMSFHALQRGLEVVYNDKDTDMAALMDFIIGRIRNGDRSKYGLLPEEWYKFITKEDFDDIKKQTGAYAQFVRVCYSFGNKCNCYMYRRELETVKRLLHDVVIYQDIDSLMKLRDLLNDNTIEMPTEDDWNTGRLSFMRCIKRIENLGSIIQRQNLESIMQIENLGSIMQIQNLGSIKRIENLERIKRIENISTVNVSFSDVAISTPYDDTIVYLDPPYIGTAEYKEQCSHEALYDYMRNSKYTCFLSEYTAPFDGVWSKDVVSTVGKNKHGNYRQATERLFINRYPDDYNPQPTQGSLLDYGGDEIGTL